MYYFSVFLKNKIGHIYIHDRTRANINNILVYLIKFTHETSTEPKTTIQKESLTGTLRPDKTHTRVNRQSKIAAIVKGCARRGHGSGQQRQNIRFYWPLWAVIKAVYQESRGVLK